MDRADADDDRGEAGDDEDKGVRGSAEQEAQGAEQGEGDDEPVAFAGAVGESPVDQHGGSGYKIHRRDEEAYFGGGEAGCVLQDGGSGEGVGVAAGEHAEHEGSQEPDAWVA